MPEGDEEQAAHRKAEKGEPDEEPDQGEGGTRLRPPDLPNEGACDTHNRDYEGRLPDRAGEPCLQPGPAHRTARQGMKSTGGGKRIKNI